MLEQMETEEVGHMLARSINQSVSQSLTQSHVHPATIAWEYCEFLYKSFGDWLWCFSCTVDSGLKTYRRPKTSC